MMFCLDDGAELLYGPASMDEPATAILSEPRAVATGFPASESPTRAQIHTTDQTAVLPAGSIAETALRPTSSAEFLVNEAKKNKRGVAAGFIVLLLVLGGFGYWYLNGRAPSASINSIAVLPFQNRSDDADTDYLSDGLAESLIFRLSQLPGLKVSPTSSVIRYKGTDRDVARIAKELGVDSVMTGRLVKRGDSLNITVELVDARDNKSLWGEQYERKMSDLMATQREIAATIVQKLELKLSGSETKGITKQYTDSNEAYQLYLKARYHFAKRTKDDILKSIDYNQQAIKLDPNFARAYVAIAEAYSSATSFPYMSPAESTPKAKDAVEKALELDPDLPEAHTVAGMIAATYDWDYPKAEREFKRALELDPNIALTHFRYAWVYLSPLGRHDEAVVEMKKAMELEPLSIIQGANYAAVLMYARRYDEALEQAKKTYELDPTHVGAQSWLAHAYNAKGMYAESLAITEKTSRPDYSFWAHMGYAYAKLGRRKDAEAALQHWEEDRKTRYVSSYWVAVTYAAIGDKDAAFAELEKSYQNRDWFLQRLKTDPFMDPLRDDPRFADLVRRIGLSG